MLMVAQWEPNVVRKALAILISLALVGLWPEAGWSQRRGISLLRDAEIERDLRAFVDPILEAAGIESQAVQIFLVNDKSINAFVAGGQNLFIHTGLLMAAQTPSQLIGVMAHETGHIAGGDVARSGRAIASAGTVSIISMLAGIAMAVAGAADAGASLIASSGQFAQMSFLAYSRTQESQADQAALKFLRRTKQSANGLISFFELLESEELKITTNRDPYIRSHPLTRERISRLYDAARASPYWDTPENPRFVNMLKRMKAKLRGYMLTPRQTLNFYPPSDNSIYARYARAFAYHKAAFTDKAIAEVNTLLDDVPHDPYFLELKGQILFESGKVKRAIEPYREAVHYAPGETLLRVGLAQAIIASEDPKYLDEAITNLKVANQRDPYNSFSWYQLAIAYSLKGDKPMADISTAERYLLTGRNREALMLAKRASTQIPKNTPGWWRAQDIVYLAKSEQEAQGKKPQDDGDRDKGDRDGGGDGGGNGNDGDSDD